MYKVLIIEDEEEVLESLADMLRSFNYEVITALDGADGVNKAFEVIPDIIICDIIMPELNGFEVIQLLKQNPLTFSIPFLFLTAKSGHREKRFGMELGADDYITKPFDPEEILRLIKARIKKSIDLKKFHENNLEELRKNIAISLPHELRTPLTVILGFAEILKTGYHSLSEEEVIEISESITDSGNRLLRLIANYSHYVELVNLESFSGKVQFKGVVSAERVIIETSETIAYKYHRLKDLEFDIRDSRVHIFESHLMKMIEHLVDNSFKFSENGSKVKITAYPEKELYHIKITNTSFGMSDEDISKIGAFMQFNRGSYEQQGTGLGLSIAKKTAAVYNGTFAVNCTPEREIIVSISLLID